MECVIEMKERDLEDRIPVIPGDLLEMPQT